MRLFGLTVLCAGLVACSGGTFPADWGPSPAANSDAGPTSEDVQGNDERSSNVDVSNPQGADASTAPCTTMIIYHDADGDGYGNNATAIKHCADQPYADDWTTQGGDCDDSNSSTYPSDVEFVTNDGIDNNCDGLTDNVKPYDCANCKPMTHCVDPDKDGMGYCEANVCDPDECFKSIDGVCNANNVCTSWGCLPDEICYDTNGNGYCDLCKPVTTNKPPAGVVSPKGICKGTVLFVPYNCPTIQAAVNAAEKNPTCSTSFKVYTTNIFVQPGVYKEGILVQDNRNVKIQHSADSGQVTIDGGLKHAFQINECSTLALQDLTIKNEQNIGNTTWPSTVFVNLGGSIDIDHCELHTQSFGVTTGYASWTWVTNSVIIGDTIDFETVGLDLNFENYPTKELGPHILNNTFQHLKIGMQSCMASPAALSESGSTDSNSYKDVATPIKGNNWPSCVY